MDIRKIVEGVIEDLSNDVSIAKIMLKSQLIASVLDDANFTQWIENEQSGYDFGTILPKYRKVGCGLKAHISIPFQGILQNFEIPIGAILNKQKREDLSIISFYESISELEKMNDQGCLKVNVHASLFSDINKLCPNGNIEAAWKYTNSSAATSAVERVKSLLLKFFLELDKQLDWDIEFDVLMNKTKINNIMTIINAGIVHTGTGNIESNQSTNTGGENNTVNVSEDIKSQISDLLSQISALKTQLGDDEQDIADCIAEIKQELGAKVSSPKILKRSLQALKSFSKIVNEETIKFGLNKVLSLLSVPQ